MRIGIDVTASIYAGTGVGTYYQSLVPELLRIGSAHEFVLLGYAFRRFSELTLANRKFPFPPRLMELLWNRLHILPIEHIVGSVDVFHAWDYLQPPRKKAKIITTIHDLTTIKFPMYHHPSTVQAQEHRLKWIRKEADCIIADSKATKQDIVDLLGIEENRIRVIYLAAGKKFREYRLRANDYRKAEIERVGKKYGLRGQYFLSVGTQEPRKNLKRTIEAFQIFQEKYPEIQLAIVGRLGWGDYLPVTKDVKILGKVPAEDLPALYTGSTALLYPSLYEGFGLPILEAMEAGCPVITSDRGSLKEVAGPAAVLIDPEDVSSISRGMETVMEQRDSLIKKGLKQAQKFSWEKTAKETLQAYESVVSG